MSEEVETCPPEQAEMSHRTLIDRRLGQEGSNGSILLPVDDSDDSERALDFAISFFPAGLVFHLLHVVPEPQMVHVWAGVYVPPDEDAELIEVEDTKLMVTHRFAKKLLAAKIPFHLHVIVGPIDTENVAKLIRRKAKDLGSKCVVLARHGKGKMREMWVGSVTKALAAKPPADHIPVIVVPHN